MTTAVVVGSGPNGLAAAAVLAKAGVQVTVLEANDTIGGGARTEELTLPGFLHDTCSAIHPLAVASPFFSMFGDDLAGHGLAFVHPEIPAAHPQEDGSAGVLHRDLERTVAALGVDGPAWRRLIAPLVDGWDDIGPSLLGPLLSIPKHPFQMARFGLNGIKPATSLADRFSTPQARGLLGGMAAHSILPIDAPLTSSFGLLLAAVGHRIGWPAAVGGSQAISDALAAYVTANGGRVETGRRVATLDEVDGYDLAMLDITPRQFAAMAGDRLPSRFRAKMEAFRYGPGVFKIDYALDAPVPWTNPDCAGAGTVHVGGTIEEVALAEREVADGRMPERPFVLVAQQSVFDPTRAPAGKQTLWAYCHVPSGWTGDATRAIEDQLERFAPGFRERVLARHTMGPQQIEAHNVNYVGGDIGSGSHDGLQLFARPRVTLNPYATPLDGVYLCSASTPPGAGVHGMCGYHAATTALAQRR